MGAQSLNLPNWWFPARAVATMAFSILSGSIQTMHRWQNAEVRREISEIPIQHTILRV
jgi:hypothetical protein